MTQKGTKRKHSPKINSRKRKHSIDIDYIRGHENSSRRQKKIKKNSDINRSRKIKTYNQKGGGLVSTYYNLYKLPSGYIEEIDGKSTTYVPERNNLKNIEELYRAKTGAPANTRPDGTVNNFKSLKYYVASDSLFLFTYNTCTYNTSTCICICTYTCTCTYNTSTCICI